MQPGFRQHPSPPLPAQADDPQAAFHGAKLALFLGRRIVVIRRDNRPGLSHAGALDLPGGGREGCESPTACVLRETREELRLTLPRAALLWGRCFAGADGRQAWLFAARLPARLARDIRLGREGQGWRLMMPVAYLTHPRAIAHFRPRLRACLTAIAP